MGEVEFEKLRVSRRSVETAELTLLRVEGAADDFYERYQVPGQFVRVRLPEAEKPGFLALASLPGEPWLEFLVRGGGRFAEALRHLQVGDTLEVSAPEGRGYPVGEAKGRDAWLVGAGSGLAPLRPLVRFLLDRPAEHGPLHLVAGARGGGHLAFAGEIELWRAAGVEVVLALSRETPGAPHVERGYVQEALLRRAPDLTRAVVYACGMSAMIEGLRQAARGLGLPDERFHTNY